MQNFSWVVISNIQIRLDASLRGVQTQETKNHAAAIISWAYNLG